jgi:glutamate-ammonia-ligase adenylyltransferase
MNLPTRASSLRGDVPLESLSDADWRGAGFAEPARARVCFAHMSARPECSGLSAERLTSVARALSASSDPDQALALFESWMEAGGAAATPAWLEPQFMQALVTLFAATPALSSYFVRFPGRTHPVIQAVLAREVAGGKAWRWMLSERLKLAGTHAERLEMLRHMRVECMLQIATLDLLLISPLNSTVRALSELADACIETALEIVFRRE